MIHSRGTVRLFIDERAVSTRVFGKVIATHEAFVALWTRKSLLSRVCSDVPLKLVRTHESLAAEQPIADERSLTAVPAQVRFEMRRLGVHLVAAGDMTGVLSRRRRRRRFGGRCRDGLTATFRAVAARTDMLLVAEWCRVFDTGTSSGLDSRESRSHVTSVALVGRRRH